MAQPAQVEKIVSINGVVVNTDKPPDIPDIEAATRSYEANRQVFQGLTRGLYQAQDDSDALVETLEKVVKKQRVLSRQVNTVASRMMTADEPCNADAGMGIRRGCRMAARGEEAK